MHCLAQCLPYTAFVRRSSRPARRAPVGGGSALWFRSRPLRAIVLDNREAGRLRGRPSSPRARRVENLRRGLQTSWVFGRQGS
jgi:hypothetical protein